MRPRNLFGTPSIRRSISSAFLIITVVVMALVAASFLQLRQVKPSSDLIIQDSEELVELERLSVSISALDVDLERYLTIRSATYKEDVQKDLQEMANVIAGLQEDPDTTPEIREVVTRLETATADLQTKVDLVFSTLDSSSSGDINRSVIGVYQTIDQAKEHQQELSTLTLTHLQSTAQAQGEIASKVLTQSVVLGIIVAMIAVITTLLTDRRLRTISSLTNTAVAISGGDFSRLAPVESNDEIGTLAASFNTMTSQLRDLIGSLEQRVEERTKALSSVAEVGTAVSTILETDKLLQQVVDLTKERFDFYHTHIYLLNDAGDTLVLAAGAGEPGRQMVAEGRSIPLDREQSLVARAAREKKGVTVNDVTTEPDFLPNPLLPDTHSELAVPMMVGEEVVGVFDVQSDIVGRFTDADIAVQTTLASQIATSVQNSRSYIKALNAQQLTRSVIDSTDDWIFIKDQDHRYQLVNQGYANSLHIPIADFIGRNDLELGFPEELVKGNPEKGIRGFWADDRAVMDGGVAKQIPDDFVTIDGNIRVFDTLKVPLRDADNKVWGVLAFARDMTERRNLEELNRKRATEQEALNQITQKIQGTTSVEMALQITARELGHALGQKPTLVALDMATLAGENKVVVNE